MRHSVFFRTLFSDTIVGRYADYWWRGRRYYYYVYRFYQSQIPSHSKILVCKCDNNTLLDAMAFTNGVVIGDSGDQPSYAFFNSLADVPSQGFDYIILSFSVMEAEDIQVLFQSLQRFCTS